MRRVETDGIRRQPVERGGGCITLDQPSARRIGPPMKEERHTRDERGVEEQLQLEWGGGIWMGLAASRELPVVYI